jgi:protein-L-isoaspartate(D-aspartate) O-methyltransferase
LQTGTRATLLLSGRIGLSIDRRSGRGAKNSMSDYAKLREAMVDGQIRVADVTDRPLLAALGAVPRERFVPAQLRPLAYIDEDLALNDREGDRPVRYLMEPAPFARLVQACQIGRDDVVLDVGCASGYSAAVISRLASSVVALECDDELAGLAAATLADLGADNVALINGPLEDGYPGEGPYDVILLEGAVEMVPDSLFDQLKDGGRLAAVVGRGRSARALLHVKEGGTVGERAIFDAHVMPLPGFEKPKTFVF